MTERNTAASKQRWEVNGYLEFVRQRWPSRVAPIWRAAKCAEEAGEVLGALNKPWLTAEDLEHEAAQLAICVMALAESAGFDLRQAIADEWRRANERVWPESRGRHVDTHMGGDAP